MKPRTILVMEKMYFHEVFGPEELARLHALVDFTDTVVDGAALSDGGAEAGPAEIILASWGMPRLDAALLQRLPRLKALFYAAGTVKNIATDASWARGIRITHAALENARPVAEYTLAGIILSLKRVWERVFLLREKQLYKQHDPLLRGCYGSTVGLLSLGNIGRLVAERLATLDVKVIAYDPFISPAEAEAMGVRLCSLEEVFAESDVVSCHMPLVTQTDGILRRAHFAAMRPGATFINTARGGIVNEPEMIEVLTRRPDLYAMLDVMADEPPPPGSALLRLPNVVLTPHIAGSMGPECRRMGRMMVEEVERYLAGRPLRGEVLQDQLEVLA